MSTTTPMLLTEPRRRVSETASTPSSARATTVSPSFDRTIVTRILVPLLAALAVVAVIARSSAAAGLAMFVAAWVVLDIAALTVGHDSRDGLDWRRGNLDRWSPRR